MIKVMREELAHLGLGRAGQASALIGQAEHEVRFRSFGRIRMFDHETTVSINRQRVQALAQ